MIQLAVFSRYDIDHSGFLEENEVKNFLHDALIDGGNSKDETENLTQKFYIEADKNGDGKISKQEFMAIVKCIIERKISSVQRGKKPMI